MNIQRHAAVSPETGGESWGASALAGLFGGRTLFSPEALEQRTRWILSQNYAWPLLEKLFQEEIPLSDWSAPQKANLEAVREGRCVFLMTGQQPGLLGGPLLWLYKALTCARQAATLTARLGLPVVPIFWVAGDDSDLAECNHVELLEMAPWSHPKVLALDFPDPERLLPVSERRISSSQLESLLRKAEKVWSPEVLTSIQACYRPGLDLAQAFTRLAQRYLAKEGVLFVNGYSALFRQMARPRLQEVVFGWRRIEAGLAAGTRSMVTAGLKPQLHLPDGLVHAFDLSSGVRRRLQVHSGAKNSDVFFLAGNPDRPLSSEEMGRLDLSHDVVSRAMVADSVFPIVGHVLGPSELKYFAQMRPAFETLTGDFPLVAPRMSATLIPSDTMASLGAKGFSPEELPRLKPSLLQAHLKEKLWVESSHGKTFQEDDWREVLRPWERAHFTRFSQAGPMEYLSRNIEKAWKGYVDSLKNTVYREERQKFRDLFAQLRWLGNGLGQDRYMNIHSLLNALGEDGLERYLAELDPMSLSEQIFSFKDG